MKDVSLLRLFCVLSALLSVPLSVAAYFYFAGALQPIHKQLTDIAWSDDQGALQTLHDDRYSHTFLITGFVHCVDFCSQRVRELRGIDDKIPEGFAGVRFLWLNLQTDASTRQQRYQYFDQHSSRFYSLEADELSKTKLLRELGQSSASKDPRTHLARLYHLDHHGNVVRAYTQRRLPINTIVESLL